MIVKTENKQQLVQVHGNGYMVHFNEKEVDGGFEYDQCELSNSPDRREIIESMIASRYSLGAEFAAINNKEIDPQGYEQYQAWRVLCKDMANLAMEQI